MKLQISCMEEFQRCAEGKKVYLFGASKSAEGFIERNGHLVKIEGIFDNSEKKWGTSLKGYEIYPIDKLHSLDYQNTVIVITSVYEKEIEEQLFKIGFQYIVSSHMCEDANRNWLEPIAQEDMEAVYKVREMLGDDLSVKRLNSIIRYRESRAFYWEGMMDGAPYFREFFCFSPEEVFVDGGAYTGDTIEDFMRVTDGHYRKIYAFEPATEIYQQLLQNVGNNSKIECIQSGLWSRNTTMKFNDMNTDGSSIDENGEITVNVKSIDETISEEVTFIKMDIEGSELEALKGAEKTIKKYHPKLAICIYHKYDDLWRIPLYIHQLEPKYKLYIRHHSLGCSDTVLYAVYDG